MKRPSVYLIVSHGNHGRPSHGCQGYRKTRKNACPVSGSFAPCFVRIQGRSLLSTYVQGLLPDVQRKNVEAIALNQKVAPRTLQRFLESIVWDEQKLRDQCQRIVATEHAHPDAIGCVDETGIAKSGKHTADELYGRDGTFLDGLDSRGEAYVVEVPPNAHVWLTKPKVLKNPPINHRGRPKVYLRLRKKEAQPREVQNLAKYSPEFREQTPQRYRIKDTHRGSEAWEIRWHTCWRKTHTDKLVSNQCTLIVARNVLTNETKYFLSNRVAGRDGWSLRKILRVAFGRWPIEDCFREAQEELGLDHFEGRGWHCIHRHLYVTILSQLFCAKVRQKLSSSEDVFTGELLTLEQVRRAANVYVSSIGLPPRVCSELYQAEVDRQAYYARRNAAAAKSYRKTRRKRLGKLGVDADKIKSVASKPAK